MKLLFLILIIISQGSLYPQVTDSTSLCVKIETNINNPLISIDSAEFTSLKKDCLFLSAGSYYFEIKSGNQDNVWGAMNISRTVEIYSDTILTLKAPVLYTFTTDPFNASVYFNDSLLGFTPLRYLSDKLLTGEFSVRKDGFKSVFENFDTSKVFYKIILKPANSLVENEVIINRAIGFETPRNWLVISGLGALTISGAYGSFNLKSKANEFYDEYLKTSDETKLDKSKQFDVYFAISLIAMQAALTGLIYYLFFD